MATTIHLPSVSAACELHTLTKYTIQRSKRDADDRACAFVALELRRVESGETAIYAVSQVTATRGALSGGTTVEAFRIRGEAFPTRIKFTNRDVLTGYDIRMLSEAEFRAACDDFDAGCVPFKLNGDALPAPVARRAAAPSERPSGVSPALPASVVCATVASPAAPAAPVFDVPATLGGEGDSLGELLAELSGASAAPDGEPDGDSVTV